MGFLQGKKILIVGLLSNKSIAYGVANAMHREGAELAFTYQNDRFYERLQRLTASFNTTALIQCNVNNDKEISNIFSQLNQKWDGIDSIVHSVAFAPAGQLEGDFIDAVTREGFQIAHDVSVYSFVALAKQGREMMKNRNSSLLTMTYLGSERAMPSYNTMGLAKASLESAMRYTALALGSEGIRVNAISAGPVRTLASSGIKGFRKILNYNAQVSPLKRNIDIMEIGNTAAFLCSDLASGITGEVLHVDAGYHCVSIGNF